MPAFARNAYNRGRRFPFYWAFLLARQKGAVGGYPSSCVSLLFPDRMKKGRRGRRPVSLSCVSLACGGLSLSRVPLCAGGVLFFSQVSFVSWRSVLPLFYASFHSGAEMKKGRRGRRPVSLSYVCSHAGACPSRGFPCLQAVPCPFRRFLSFPGGVSCLSFTRLFIPERR